MALAIAASLTGVGTPQKVELVITGLTAGTDVYTVTGSTAGSEWTVRGAEGVLADGTQAVVTDVATPINVPIMYTVTVGATTATDGPVTVAWAAGNALLQSMDGTLTAGVKLRGQEDPKALGMRGVLFDVAGRSRPPGVFDLASDYAGALVAAVTTTDLESLLKAGGLCTLRTDESMIDVPGVDHLLFTGASSVWEWPDKRVWTLPYQLVDDPEPSAVVPLSTGSDFDAYWATLTGTDFDALFSGGTGYDFNAIDWTVGP